MQDRSEKEIILNLHSLAAEDGYIHTISILLQMDLYFDATTDFTKLNPRDYLSYSELGYLIGLLFSTRVSLTEPDPSTIQDQIDRTRALMIELHAAFEHPMREIIQSTLQGEPPKSDPFCHGKVLREPMLYGADSGYDFQMVAMAAEKYKYDEAWLREKKKIDIAICNSMYMTLRQVHLAKLLELGDVIHKTKVAPTTLLHTFCFRRETLQEYGDSVICDFLKNFSAKPKDFERGRLLPAEYNILHSKPIVEIESDLYFLPICNLLARSLYETPFYWMNEDHVYQNQAATNRGRAVEEMAYSRLCRTFGTENTFRGIKVHRSKAEEATDIDVLAICGNRALIVQAKAKRLTELSKLGNDEQIRNDFEKAVQSAYTQGLIARTAILSSNGILTDQNGETISLHENIREAYIICLLADDYPALLMQTENFLKKPTPNSASPIAINLLDLDVLVHYLDDPYDFLFYVHQRTDLADSITSGHELNLLGYHLNHKLFAFDDCDSVLIGEDFGQLVDANFITTQGECGPIVGSERLGTKWRNERFERLLDQLKETGEPRITDVIFFLFMLSSGSIDQLTDSIEFIEDLSRKDLGTHDCSFLFGDKGLSVVCGWDRPEIIFQRTIAHAKARKYKSRANFWIGLGKCLSNDRGFDCVVLSEQNWVYDPKLEELAKISLHTPEFYIPKGSQKLVRTSKIGRNDPCHCGSGRKFKHCCLK